MVLLEITLPLFPSCQVSLRFNPSFLLPSSSLHSSLLPVYYIYSSQMWVSIHLKYFFLTNLCSSHLSSNAKISSSEFAFHKHISWKRIFSQNFLECTPIVHHEFSFLNRAPVDGFWVNLLLLSVLWVVPTPLWYSVKMCNYPNRSQLINIYWTRSCLGKSVCGLGIYILVERERDKHISNNTKSNN